MYFLWGGMFYNWNQIGFSVVYFGKFFFNFVRSSFNNSFGKYVFFVIFFYSFIIDCMMIIIVIFYRY